MTQQFGVVRRTFSQATSASAAFTTTDIINADTWQITNGHAYFYTGTGVVAVYSAGNWIRVSAVQESDQR